MGVDDVPGEELPPPVCPRCGHWIPDDKHPGAYPGPRSRRFPSGSPQAPEVCTPCGKEETMLHLMGYDLSQETWPITLTQR